MKRYIFTILLAMMLTGCNGMTRYYEDKEVLVIGVQLTTDVNYKYIYTIQMYTSDNTHSGGYDDTYMYSNKRYSVGDVIWIGARWGRKMDKNNE